MLHATNIRVRQGGKTLLHNISMSLIGGELVGLLGPSGAGKSTLLRALAGESELSEGDIWLAGQPLVQWSLRDLALRRALLPQNPDGAFAVRALEVVLLGRAPQGMASPTYEDLTIAHQALHWTEASHLAERVFTTLSGGERQQVQLARILAQVWGRPPQGDCYIFLDSPTFGLDLKHQHRTLAIARQLARDGAAVAMVLHDINHAAHYCDRLLMLREGQLVAEGTPREVITSTTLRRVFDVQVVVSDHPTEGTLWVMPQLA